MRIAWVVYGSLEQPTGGYVYDRLVVQRLREAGRAVDVLSIEPGDPGGIALATQLAALDADVVVGDELCFRELGVAFGLLPPGVARVLLVHHLGAWELEPGPERSATLAEEARVAGLADAVIATSPSTAARLASDLGLSAVHVATPGADRLAVVAFRPADRLRLLFVGSYQARKRVVLLVEAFGRLSLASATLTLVGDATREPACTAEVRRAIEGSAYLREHVVERGVVGDGALPRVFAEADALVLPSSLEGYGMVLTEALHAGVPVVVSEGAAVPEPVREGGASIVFEEGGLERAIARFAGDAALRARLREAAGRLSAQLPTWAETTRSVREALDAAMADRQARRST